MTCLHFLKLHDFYAITIIKSLETIWLGRQQSLLHQKGYWFSLNDTSASRMLPCWLDNLLTRASNWDLSQRSPVFKKLAKSDTSARKDHPILTPRHPARVVTRCPGEKGDNMNFACMERERVRSEEACSITTIIMLQLNMRPPQRILDEVEDQFTLCFTSDNEVMKLMVIKDDTQYDERLLKKIYIWIRK